MRTIRKRPPPSSLVQWRQAQIAAHGADGFEFNYEAMRSNEEVLKAVEDGLHQEQGGICAYTGRKIRLSGGQPREIGFHLEHLKPQQHCIAGEDCDYANLVACWPPPNQQAAAGYGAVRKGSWPSREEEADFVSPLRADCTQRFAFDRHGNITAALDGDAAARTTIENLCLGDGELNSLRRAAIRGALNPASRQIRLAEALKLRGEMDKDESLLNQGGRVKLREFSFAVRQVLEKEITKLRAIENRP